ncbi:MAG TPA: hypothetical protein VJT75_06030 [Thermoleophilaceae bacterium]|nr:hypothetical protein [Thermoleophilaceae bacterium]
MSLGARGAVALVAVSAALAFAGSEASAAPAGTCVQTGYHCSYDGLWREAASNTEPRCTWTYNVDWGDGTASSFIVRPNRDAHVDHRYRTSRHGIFRVVIDVPQGVSSDPKLTCTGGHYVDLVEVPGPAVRPCVPARRTRPPDCDRRGVKGGSPLLDQVPSMKRSTLDFLLLADIRTFRKAQASAREMGEVIASYLVPQSRLSVVTRSALARLGSGSAKRVLRNLTAAEAALVTAGDRDAIEPSFRSAEAQDVLTGALLKDRSGRWLGREDGVARTIDLSPKAAGELYRRLSRLGDTTSISRGPTTVSVSNLPNGDIVQYSTAGPSMRYLAAGVWTTFRFAGG